MIIENAQITLEVSGKKMTFTEEKLISILEKEFNITQEEKIPNEIVLCEVYPLEINRNLFQTKRKNRQQEETRKLILEAFSKVNEYPEKYGNPFKTLMPEAIERWMTIGELRKLASKMGDHIADWVEQAMEWAQRIQNGETWETICNNPDITEWFRMIAWKDGGQKLVGGARRINSQKPASYIEPGNVAFYAATRIHNAVPLIVRYE